MSAREIIARATATFVQAFTATLIAGGLSEQVAAVDLWQRAAVAGGAALVSLAHRTADAYLDTHRGGDE